MNAPILLFGLPRSGTTWIGKLFDSHPDTLYRHEPDSVQRLAMPLFPDKSEAQRYRSQLESFVLSLPSMRSPKVAGKQPLFPKHYHSTAALYAYRASVAWVKLTGRVNSPMPLPYRPTASGYEGARLVWKSIESVGRLGVCLEALPDARAIYILRHPCGYVASVLRGEADDRFGDLIPSSEDYGFFELLLATASASHRKLALDDLKKLTPEERLAWCWVLTQEKMLADTEYLDRVLLISYEEVCANPIAATRRMFEFSGLQWHPQTEQFIFASTSRPQDDYYGVYKNPQVTAQLWQSELEPQVIDRISNIFQDSRLRNFYAPNPPIASQALRMP